MDSQNRVDDFSRSHQEREDSRRSGAQQQRHDSSQQRGKKTVDERQASESPKAKKHKSTDSEESEYSDEYCAQNQDSGRTVFYPDLFVLTKEEHWTMTPATHKYAAAAGSFCFSITEDGEQQEVCNLITIPNLQRSLYLNEATNDYEIIKTEVPDGVDGQTRDMLERCMTTCGRAAGTRAKMRSRARKEASVQEVRGYYKQFAEAKHL